MSATRATRSTRPQQQRRPRTSTVTCRFTRSSFRSAITSARSSNEKGRWSLYIEGRDNDSEAGLVAGVEPADERQPLEGIQTREPAYNLDAVWIEKTLVDEAKSAGYTIVAPETVLITHLQDLILRNGHLLLTRPVVEKLVESAQGDLGGLVDELIPSILTYADIQRVLQSLLQARAVRNNQYMITIQNGRS